MICSSRQKITDGLDGFRLDGIDDVGGSESSGLVESLRLDVDDDDPRSTCGLGERKLLGYDGKLVFVDERAFGEAAQPEALEQSSPIAA